MIGVILSGGSGTRLFPSTIAVSKQLHCVYDKPMIYYSLSLLMNLDIKKIVIISNTEYIPLYKKLLGNGEKFGIQIHYICQPKPNGIAEALILSKRFTKNKNVSLLLGDNIFYSNDLLKKIKIIRNYLNQDKACIIGYNIKNPNEYGVVKFKNEVVTKIIEKPKNFISNVAVTGLYFYPKSHLNFVLNLKPSKRGELEITAVNNLFLENKKLEIETLSSGDLWMDLGNHDALLRGSQFVEAIEKRQGFKIGCPEEIALKKGFILKKQFKKYISMYPKSDYKNYLLSLI